LENAVLVADTLVLRQLEAEVLRLRTVNAELLAALEDIASRVDEGTELGLEIKACAVIARLRANE
jgi:hypothetical protein